MTPVSPVMPGSEPIEIVLGANQPEYIPLPAVYLNEVSCPMLTRWRLSDEERVAIAAGADVVMTQTYLPESIPAGPSAGGAEWMSSRSCVIGMSHPLVMNTA